MCWTDATVTKKKKYCTVEESNPNLSLNGLKISTNETRLFCDLFLGFFFYCEAKKDIFLYHRDDERNDEDGQMNLMPYVTTTINLYGLPPGVLPGRRCFLALVLELPQNNHSWKIFIPIV